MLAPEVLQLTQETVQELHAQGQEARAQAVEALLEVATSALTGQWGDRPRTYFTVGQLSRALALPRSTIEGWIASGELQALRAGKQTLVHRAPSRAASTACVRGRLNRPCLRRKSAQRGSGSTTR